MHAAFSMTATVSDAGATTRANLRYNQALGFVGKQAEADGMADTVRPMNWRYISHAEGCRMARRTTNLKLSKLGGVGMKLFSGFAWTESSNDDVGPAISKGRHRLCLACDKALEAAKS